MYARTQDTSGIESKLQGPKFMLQRTQLPPHRVPPKKD
jgi:hypothetical protein